MDSNKIVLEILVDRLNEKGAYAFEQILNILHKVLEDKPSFIYRIINRKKFIRPIFTFEIAKIGNLIRFFFIVEKGYKNFLINQIYAHYSNIEIHEVDDYLQNIPDEKMICGKIKLENHYLYPIKLFTSFTDSSIKEIIDPFSSITSALNKAGKEHLEIFQVNFSPLWDEDWKKSSENDVKILLSRYPKKIKKLLLEHRYLKLFLFPIFLILKLMMVFVKQEEEISEEVKDKHPHFIEKLDNFGYEVDVNLIVASDDTIGGKLHVRELFSTLGVFSVPNQNGFDLKKITVGEQNVKKRLCGNKIILNTGELSGLVHMPTTYVKTPSINWILSRMFEPPNDLMLLSEGDDLTPIGSTNYRGTKLDFGIATLDRRRHVYIIGKTGMGKTTLLESMIFDDIIKGRGVGVVDPHGDLAEKIIGMIPKKRTNNVVIIDPSDADWPIAFNMLENVSDELRPLVASGIVGIFKRIFGEVSWGPRLEHILRNTVLSLLEYPGATMISIPIMLTNEAFRKRVVNKITDPIVKKFWASEYDRMAPNQKVEAAGPILNKVGQFLSSSRLRNILGQPKTSFSPRWAMDKEKIIIVNISKGKIGEDASNLLGSMIITKFQIDAMSRADIKESDRVDFFLYVDEFQNFATDSFATILSEARKYKLSLVMANQYIDQMPESVRGAVFGNVGSMIAFQLGYHDAELMKENFGSDMLTEDFTNLRKFSIYTKLLISGMPSRVFSADAFPPQNFSPEAFASRYDKILKVSREKYSTSRIFVEKKIMDSVEELDVIEKELLKRKENYKEKMKEEKRQQYEVEKAKKEKDRLDELRTIASGGTNKVLNDNSQTNTYSKPPSQSNTGSSNTGRNNYENRNSTGPRKPYNNNSGQYKPRNNDGRNK